MEKKEDKLDSEKEKPIQEDIKEKIKLIPLKSVEQEPASFEEKWAVLVEKKEEPQKKPKLELVLDNEKIDNLEKDIQKVSSHKKKNSMGDYDPAVKYEESKYNEVIGDYNPLEIPGNSDKNKESRQEDNLNLIKNDNLRLQKKYENKR